MKVAGFPCPRRGPLKMPAMSALQTRAQQTRQKLLDCTGQLLADAGYAAWSEEKLCEVSGVSRGALRHHFPAGRYDILPAYAASVVDGQVRAVQALGNLSSRERAYLFLLRMMDSPPSPATQALLELWMAARGDARLAVGMAPVMEAARLNVLGSADGEPAGEAAAELLALRYCLHGASLYAFSPDFDPAALRAALGWLLAQLPTPTDLGLKLAQLRSLRPPASASQA